VSRATLSQELIGTAAPSKVPSAKVRLRPWYYKGVDILGLLFCGGVV